MVATVVLRPARVGTLAQVALNPGALQVVQEDVSRAGAEVGLPQGGHGLSAPQLSAHDPGFIQVPEVITHGAPDLLVEDFHAS